MRQYITKQYIDDTDIEIISDDDQVEYLICKNLPNLRYIKNLKNIKMIMCDRCPNLLFISDIPCLKDLSCAYCPLVILLAPIPYTAFYIKSPWVLPSSAPTYHLITLQNHWRKRKEKQIEILLKKRFGEDIARLIIS